jgi:hypothetical protein
MKVNNGKACACPLEEAVNCKVLGKKELAMDKFFHSFLSASFNEHASRANHENGFA